jgi:pimeloyl-ACP methyl ester carboxylesterase/DNA-binding CsgD family transcriptional regulator
MRAEQGQREASQQVVDQSVFETEFESRFEAALAAAAPEAVVRPNISTTAMACIFLDENYEAIWTDPRFESWTGKAPVDHAVCEEVRARQRERIVQTTDDNGRPLLLIYAPFKTAVHWPIKVDIAGVGRGSAGAVAVGALSLAHLSDDLVHTARAFGLNNLEAKIAVALVEQGSMKQAANQCGITYNTARKAAADAMRKMAVSSQTQLVRKLTELVTSVAPPREAAERLLVDTFGFTLRQARLALLLAEGHSRQQVARIAGLSSAVAKDNFSAIFETLGISKAPQLPRIVMEVFMLALLGDAEQAAVSGWSGKRLPLTLVHRPDGSLIAASDFGPRDGKPVLIMHSSVTTRHPLRKLVTALQAAGYRPITIDRPGYGMSDDIPPDPVDAFATGTQDVRLVCERLGIDTLDLVTRGGSFAGLALARNCPELVGRVVVINPDLLQQHCSTRKGALGIVRSGFDRFPTRVERIARWAAAQLTPAFARKFVTLAIKNSAVDLACFEDEQNLFDYQRSIQVHATGRLSGFIREQKGYATQEDCAGLSEATRWTIVVGDGDPIHDISEILAFWQAKLPDAGVLHITGGGRFIELSHTDEVVRALSGERDR